MFMLASSCICDALAAMCGLRRVSGGCNRGLVVLCCALAGPVMTSCTGATKTATDRREPRTSELRFEVGAETVEVPHDHLGPLDLAYWPT